MNLGISFMGVILFIVQYSSRGDKVKLNFQWSSNSKTKIVYSKQGAPLVTNDTENLYRDSSFRFYPKYYVLEHTDASEKSFYVTLEDPTIIFFHLYGLEHPVNDNYRISVKADSHPVVENCNKTDSCHQNLLESNKAFLRVTNQSLSSKTVFISWKHASDGLLFILIQYKNYTTECKDRSTFRIHKLVINGTQQQEGSLKNYFQYKLGNPVINGSSQTFTLNNDAVVYVQSLQCMFCVTRYHLKCNQSSFNDVVLVYGLDAIEIYENGMMSPDWSEVIIPQYRDKRVGHLSDCKLEIQTRLSEDMKDKQKNLVAFLDIAETVANIHLNRNNKVRTPVYAPFCAFDRIDKTSNWRWKKNFSLKNDDEILIETSQYSTDVKTFYLKCDNFDETLKIEGLNGSSTAMSFEKISPSWLEFHLPRKNKPENLTNCYLSFSENDMTEICPDEKIWKIEREKNNYNDVEKSNSSDDAQFCIFEKIDNIWKWPKLFNLTVGEELIIEISQCSYCVTYFDIICSDNFNDSLVVEGLNQISKERNTRQTSPTWLQFHFPTKRIPMEGLLYCNFSLRKDGESDEVCPRVALWKVKKNFQADEHDAVEPTTTKVEQKPTTAAEEPTECFELKWQMVLLITFVIIIVDNIIFIFYIVFKKKKSASGPKDESQELLPTPSTVTTSGS